MIQETFRPDGVVMLADVTSRDTFERVRSLLFGRKVRLIGADPPYGNVVSEGWDQIEVIVGHQDSPEDYESAYVDWMIEWVSMWSELIVDGGAMYIWGGTGVHDFRPFYLFLNQVSRKTLMTLDDHITWKKVRAIGQPDRYLYCREECAYLVKGDPHKPEHFNIPLTDVLRGYQGYNPKYQAKSPYLRRSNVWVETELLRGKRHRCQKPPSINRIPIMVHTEPGDVVIDLFAGSGSLSHEAREQRRCWVAIEQGEAEHASICEWLP